MAPPIFLCQTKSRPRLRIKFAKNAAKMKKLVTFFNLEYQNICGVGINSIG
jgi:hypothetical protein